MKRFHKILNYIAVISIIIMFESGVINSVIKYLDNIFMIIIYIVCFISGPIFIWRLFKRNNYTLD